MGTRKLELKDIAGYLPYDLYATRNNFVGVINQINRNGNFVISCSNWHENINDKNHHKPILRPLSDLYKTITHNGKEIVPIVELAKMAIPNLKWDINKKMSIAEIISKSSFDTILFGYTGLHRYFKYVNETDRYFYYVYQYDNVEYIPDQIQLFDYLHELKIDYRGLIDAGLAVNVNTLENNPYK
ncbi:MAG: hypothetical protein LBV47_04440 [Bacteroidales bacterium]|jgi:hypothetical protein|nr:hypothetical protein [Bacteroidales bacterium]